MDGPHQGLQPRPFCVHLSCLAPGRSSKLACYHLIELFLGTPSPPSHAMLHKSLHHICTHCQYLTIVGTYQKIKSMPTCKHIFRKKNLVIDIIESKVKFVMNFDGCTKKVEKKIILLLCKTQRNQDYIKFLV